MLAHSLISENYLPLHDNNTVKEALQLMNEYKIFELPVINSNHSFLGIISESILKSKPTNKKLEELHSFFNTESVQSHNHIYEIIEKAFSKEHYCIAVTNEENEYIGLITCNKILHYFANISSLHLPGAIIVFEMPIRDFSLLKISQIIEENNAKILSLYTNLIPESAIIEVTIKLNTHEISEIVENFNRFDFTIKTYFEGYHKLHEIYKDRLDNLKYFLEI